MTTLEQIAQKLKAARESKGLSIEHICDKTKIPLHHLNSLDGGKFDDLPEPVYIAGFIKLYASQLGLNGQLLANEYREWADGENPAVGSSAALQNKNRHRIKSAPDVPILVSDDYFQKNKIESGPPTFKTIYFNLIMIILVLGLVSYLGMTQFNNYSSQIEGGNTIVPQTAGSPSAAPGGFNTAANSSGTTGSGSTVSDTTGGGAAAHNQLTISANKHVWVEVKSAATGDNLYIGFLEPGSTKVFDTPDQGLRIRAADGANLNVNYQGKIAALGAAGQETEKVFAPATATGATPGSEQLPSTAAGTTSGAGSISSVGDTAGNAHALTGAGAAASAARTSALTAAASTASSSTASISKPATAHTSAPPAVHHWRAAGSSDSSHASDGQSYKYGDGRLDSE